MVQNLNFTLLKAEVFKLKAILGEEILWEE